MTTAADLINALDEFEEEHGVRPRRIYLLPEEAAALAREDRRFLPGDTLAAFQGVPVTITSRPREQRILDCCEWEFHVRQDVFTHYWLGVAGRIGCIGAAQAWCGMAEEAVESPAGERPMLVAMDALHRLLIGAVPASVGVGPTRPALNSVGPAFLLAGFRSALTAQAGRLRPPPSRRFDSTFSFQLPRTDAVIRVATGA